MTTSVVKKSVVVLFCVLMLVMSAKPSSYLGSQNGLPIVQHPEDTQLLASDGDTSGDSVSSFAQNTTYYHDGSNTSDISGAVGQDSILYYDLEEGTGTDIYDSSDELNNATISGGEYTWISGKEGDYALQHENGTDIALDSTIEMKQSVDPVNLTVAAWMRWDGSSVPSSVAPFGDRGNEYHTWYFKHEGSYELFYDYDWARDMTVTGVDTTDWFSGNWFHFATSLNNDGDGNITMTAYINGTQVGSPTTGSGYYEILAKINSFGKGYTANMGWNGAWDNIMVFDTLLDADDIDRINQYGPSGEITSDGSQVTLDAGGIETPFSITPTSTITTAEYPFVALDITSTSGSYSIDMYDGSSYMSLQSSTSSTGTMRYNMLAVGSSLEKWRITLSGDGTLTLNYTRAYGIADFTVTESGTTASDYLYVSSSVLYPSISSGNMTLNHDPSISVNDTFTVWSLTSSTTAPEFSYYISSWSSYSSETRGSLDSGTVTDFKLRFDSAESLSAVTFIEDSTAPSVVRSSFAPTSPDEENAITLSSVVTDTVEVYSVTFDGIVYPSGFSDVDYNATEQSDNLWTYEFTAGAFPSGYYCFKVIASDGANTNTLGEYSYIDFTVAETEIRLSNTFYGEGSTSWRYTGEVNQNVSYYVYDNDTLVESGTKAEGFFSISSDFVNTIGKHIVKILFNTSSDSLWTGGSYDVTSTLHIDDVDTDQDNETCSVGFKLTSIDGTSLSYTVYETVSGETKIAEGTRTVQEGNFISIGFEKSSADIEANATVVLSDGTSTRNITIIYMTVEPESTIINEGSSVREGDVYNEGDTHYYPEEEEDNRFDNVMRITLIIFAAVFMVPIIARIVERRK